MPGRDSLFLPPFLFSLLFFRSPPSGRFRAARFGGNLSAAPPDRRAPPFFHRKVYLEVNGRGINGEANFVKIYRTRRTIAYLSAYVAREIPSAFRRSVTTESGKRLSQESENAIISGYSSQPRHRSRLLEPNAHVSRSFRG